MITLEATPLANLPAQDWPAMAQARAVRLDASLRPAFSSSGPARANLERLIGGALCITTGQQPGLFTGPLFTLFKALSAIEQARAAEAALGRAVVPVFWVAGDDHDFAEANHCFLLDGQGDLQAIELRERDASAALTPLYRELLGPEILSTLERVRGVLPDSEFRRDILDWLGRHYRPDANFASAFGGAIAELLGPQGLVVLDASHAAVKRVMAPWLLRALREASSIDRALDARARNLAAAGHDVPVAVGDGATLVMVEGAFGRDRLVLRDGRYVTRRSGEHWTAAEIDALLQHSSARFSPNVLLRPVLEAALLPTLAYVGGPSELAYLEQADPLYEILGVAPQARLPRWSGRVLEARTIRALEKQGITAEILGRDGARLETELLREEIPAPARGALQALRADLDREYQTLVGAAIGVDPTLQKPVESARNAALAGVADVEKRLISHLKKKNNIVTSQISRARTNLFPQGQPQERVIGIISFLARYGSALVDQSSSAIQSWVGSLEPAQRRS